MTIDDEQARRGRAATRATWAGRLTRLEDTPESELVAGSPAELFGLVRELTLAAWALRGEPLPDYPRSAIPGRVLRTRVEP